MILDVRGYGPLDFPLLHPDGLNAVRLLAHHCPRLTLTAWTGAGWLHVRLDMIDLYPQKEGENIDRSQLARLGGWDGNSGFTP